MKKNKFHVLYTDKDEKFHNEIKFFESFEKCEEWLESICAIYWEIGFL